MSASVFEAANTAVQIFSKRLSLHSGEGVEEVMQRLEEQDISTAAFTPRVAVQKPVCRHLLEALMSASAVEPELSAALTTLAPHLSWVQSSGYTDALLGDGFDDNYAWFEVIGDDGFFPGSDFKFGCLLLGPHRHYLDHYHPAPELYWPLTNGSKWKKGDSDYIDRAQGTIIWHPSMTVHATITTEEPLLAAFVWTKHTNICARLSVQDKA